jgi:4-hydroxy-3-polyprenylbenzoate decarboxylase
MNQAITIVMTGASGSPYGLRLLQVLLEAGEEIYLLISNPGRMVIQSEVGLSLSSRPSEIRTGIAQYLGVSANRLHVFGREDWTAPIASGSNAPRAMVICPCTSGTLSSIATGASRTLIERGADVVLKEQRKLILVIRETPFSIIHLENMLTLARAGAVIMPANPGFYNQPKSIADLVDFMVARVLDHLGIDNELMERWANQTL